MLKSQIILGIFSQAWLCRLVVYYSDWCEQLCAIKFYNQVKSMVFFLSRCTCLPCYSCLRVINFAKIRKPYFAVLGQQSNLYVFNFTISSDCFEVVQTNRMQETVTLNQCSHSLQFSPPSFYVTQRWERDSLSFPALRDRERSQNSTMLTLYTGQLLVPTQKLLRIMWPLNRFDSPL